MTYTLKRAHLDVHTFEGFIPSWETIIHRNLFTLRKHTLLMYNSDSEVERSFHEEEAKTCIRLHNDFVKKNRLQYESIRGC